jgi:hypothetical protein
MTEDEAKKKWCPMAMNNACERNPLGAALEPERMSCIASDCMMWVPEMVNINQDDSGQNLLLHTGGHCGLAK